MKLEGDAVFCFAGADAFPDGEQVLELVESCYYDFTSRLLDMTRSTTFTCDACQAIGGLGLKFIVHFGEFMVDRDDGRVDLAGPEVILAHRLLKNTVIESGGPKAYTFMSAKCFPQRQHESRFPFIPIPTTPSERSRGSCRTLLVWRSGVAMLSESGFPSTKPTCIPTSS